MSIDEDLFAGMVEQNDTNNMNSDANGTNEHSANCIDSGCGSTNQPVHINIVLRA